MYDLLQNTIIQCWHYLKNIDNIGNSNDFRDIYYLIDYLVYAVEQIYPQIPCKPKCNECCKGLISFPVTGLEWKLIKNYMFSSINTDTQSKIFKQAEYFQQQQINFSLNNIMQLYKMINKLTDLEHENLVCPFLIDDLCSIYPVRPVVCRFYGYFILKAENPSDEHSVCMCKSAFTQHRIEELILPACNKFIDKIRELNRLYNKVETLPVWVSSLYPA